MDSLHIFNVGISCHWQLHVHSSVACVDTQGPSVARVGTHAPSVARVSTHALFTSLYV